MRINLLAAFLLSVVFGPFELPRVSFVDHHTLSAFCGAKVKNCSIALNEHNARRLWEVFTAEGTGEVSRQVSDALPT
jgi:hypothetical protein